MTTREVVYGLGEDGARRRDDDDVPHAEFRHVVDKAGCDVRLADGGGEVEHNFHWLAIGLIEAIRKGGQRRHVGQPQVQVRSYLLNAHGVEG